ncbi:MAG: hypothetical protein INR73_23240 [Williamsia sp.]|nr:hypothetical protein [Williamsia sp.]
MNTEEERKPLLLVFPFGLLSHYLRCLMLAGHFKAYFKVLFAYNEQFADFVTREGFQTFSCRSLDAAEVLQEVKKFSFSWINETALEPVYLDQVRAIRLLKPAAVLGDTSVTLKMAAEKTRVPYISLMNGYMSKYYSFPRPLSRTHPLYKFMKNFPAPLASRLTRQGEALVFSWVHRPFRKIRRRHQLSSKKDYLDELEGNLNLICDLEELFPQRDCPPNYKQIAPLYYDAARSSNRVADKLDKNKKTIFVSMGSSGDWEKLRFLNDPLFRRYNIVTAADKESFLCASHIIRVPFVNVHELFPFTDLVICHGGNGTIYQALLYGIPVLCSTSHFEQEWNVGALERLRIGQSLDGVEEVKDYLQIIDDWMQHKGEGTYRGYQRKIAQQVQELGGIARRVAEEILEPRL